MTAIDLSGLQLHKLTSMDQLTNLRWLCVANNNLTSTEVSTITLILTKIVCVVSIHFSHNNYHKSLVFWFDVDVF